jgi:hypothetical protein
MLLKHTCSLEDCRKGGVNICKGNRIERVPGMVYRNVSPHLSQRALWEHVLPEPPDIYAHRESGCEEVAVALEGGVQSESEDEDEGQRNEPTSALGVEAAAAQPPAGSAATAQQQQQQQLMQPQRAASVLAEAHTHVPMASLLHAQEDVLLLLPSSSDSEEEEERAACWAPDGEEETAAGWGDMHGLFEGTEWQQQVEQAAGEAAGEAASSGFIDATNHPWPFLPRIKRRLEQSATEAHNMRTALTAVGEALRVSSPWLSHAAAAAAPAAPPAAPTLALPLSPQPSCSSGSIEVVALFAAAARDARQQRSCVSALMEGADSGTSSGEEEASSWATARSLASDTSCMDLTSEDAADMQPEVLSAPQPAPRACMPLAASSQRDRHAEEQQRASRAPTSPEATMPASHDAKAARSGAAAIAAAVAAEACLCGPEWLLAMRDPELRELVAWLMEEYRSVPVYKIVYEHHKNEHRSGKHGSRIEAVLPFELAVRLHVYLEQLHTKMIVDHTGEAHNFLFPDDKGRPMSNPQDLQNKWHRIQDEWDAPWDNVTMNPHDLRRTHVRHEVRTLTTLAERPGATAMGSAYLMGNSVTTWLDHYSNGEGRPMLAERALDEMTRWRHQQHEQWRQLAA